MAQDSVQKLGMVASGGYFGKWWLLWLVVVTLASSGYFGKWWLLWQGVVTLASGGYFD